MSGQGHKNEPRAAPTFADSLAHRWFGHRVPADGQVAAKDVAVYCNLDDSLRVRDVMVEYMPRRELVACADLKSEHPLWDARVPLDAQFDFVSGNCYEHWLSDDPDVLDRARACDPALDHHTPDKLWRYFRWCGFASADEERRARREFARIRECAWARDPSLPEPTDPPPVVPARPKARVPCPDRRANPAAGFTAVEPVTGGAPAVPPAASGNGSARAELRATPIEEFDFSMLEARRRQSDALPTDDLA